MAAGGWEGDDSLLVRMSGVVRFCCQDPATTLLAPPPPHPPSEAVVPEDPRQVTGVLDGLRAGGGRYTILPTISVVAPWDDPVPHPVHHPVLDLVLDPAHHHHHHHHSLVRDQALSDSNTVLRVVSPTPVLPPPAATTTRPTWVEDAALNATHRFYNVLRAVLHGGEEQQEASPSLRGEARSGVEVSEDEASQLPNLAAATPAAALDPAISPLIQVCAALAVVVVVMVLLFHWHHIRHECLRERRALRRLARRYRVAGEHRHDDDDDLEKNDTSNVTDVTL